MQKQQLEAIRNGDQNAFKSLVNTHKDRVLNTCFSFVKNKEDAQDLAQDVFVEAFQSIHKFRGEAQVSTWLYRIAVNKSINFLKKQQRYQFVSDYTQVASKNFHEQDAGIISENEERQRILMQAINALPENQRIAFTLHKLDGKAYKEITQIMKLSLFSVESLIHRAKQNLQKKLITYYKQE